MDLQRSISREPLVLLQTVGMSTINNTASEKLSPAPGTLAGSRKGVTTAHRIGIAVRPTLLFVTAFALNATPHEVTHAATAYMLGFSSTLYQMWVNPDATNRALDAWNSILLMLFIQL